MNSGSGLPRPSRDDGANAETSGWPRGALAALIRSQPRVSCTGPRVRSQPDDLACRIVALFCLPCAEVRHFPCAPFGCVRGANFGSIRRRRIRCTRGLAGGVSVRTRVNSREEVLRGSDLTVLKSAHTAPMARGWQLNYLLRRDIPPTATHLIAGNRTCG